MKIIPFKDLRVGHEFHFPEDRAAFQSRSQAYVKVSTLKYAPRHNFAHEVRPWNTYEAQCVVDMAVEPGEALSASELASVLRAIDETKKLDRKLTKDLLKHRVAPLPGAFGHGEAKARRAPDTAGRKHSVFARDFSAPVRRALASRGRFIVGVCAIPGKGDMPYANATRGYKIDDNGTMRIRDHEGVIGLAT